MLTSNDLPTREDGRPDGQFLRNDLTSLEQAPQFVFGKLADLSAPVLIAYRSDLYHDALWLQEHMTGQVLSFFYSFNQTGTYIGEDESLARMREHVYKLTAFIVGDAAYLHTEQVA